MFWEEHVEVGVEELFCYQVEILVLYAALVTALLGDEGDAKGRFQVLYFAQLLHAVVEDVLTVYLDVQVDQTLQAEVAALHHRVYHSRYP